MGGPDGLSLTSRTDRVLHGRIESLLLSLRRFYRMRCLLTIHDMLIQICIFIQLVINKSLDNLPRRRTDNAIIVRSKDTDGQTACIFKLNSKPLPPVLVQR
jgi:hypothetical protein